ncbi:acyl-CoA dehydrogenase family protein [Actinoplanes sp. NPDC023714]|uniref:acyl-CoA dehydrogenase family protein n=1 Tax=Actinoplanes sp. NPDC023714 TaxID=3154322 RepID=UPI0033FCA9D1
MDFRPDETQQAISRLAAEVVAGADTPERLFKDLGQAGLLDLGLGIFETSLVITEIGRRAAAIPALLIDGSAVSIADPQDPSSVRLDASFRDDPHPFAVAAACALGDGALAGALDLTAAHIRTREQFGRPLATFQAVAQQIADVYIAGRTLHLAVLSATWHLSQTPPDHPPPDRTPPDRPPPDYPPPDYPPPDYPPPGRTPSGRTPPPSRPSLLGRRATGSSGTDRDAGSPPDRPTLSPPPDQPQPALGLASPSSPCPSLLGRRIHGDDRDTATELAVAVQWLTSEAPPAMRTCHHLHGGLGLMIDYPLHRHTATIRAVCRFLGGSELALARLGDLLCSSN